MRVRRCITHACAAHCCAHQFCVSAAPTIHRPRRVKGSDRPIGVNRSCRAVRPNAYVAHIFIRCAHFTSCTHFISCPHFIRSMRVAHGGRLHKRVAFTRSKWVVYIPRSMPSTVVSMPSNSVNAIACLGIIACLVSRTPAVEGIGCVHRILRWWRWRKSSTLYCSEAVGADLLLVYQRQCHPHHAANRPLEGPKLLAAPSHRKHTQRAQNERNERQMNNFTTSFSSMPSALHVATMTSPS
jgi:hypothetical protein